MSDTGKLNPRIKIRRSGQPYIEHQLRDQDASYTYRCSHQASEFWCPEGCHASDETREHARLQREVVKAAKILRRDEKAMWECAPLDQFQAVFERALEVFDDAVDRLTAYEAEHGIEGE